MNLKFDHGKFSIIMSSSRRSCITNDEEAYHPLAIKYTKRNGTPAICNVFCGLTVKDFILITFAYIAFYSFLFGVTTLLLKGVIATNESNTFLWAFLVIGVLFCIGVMISVLLGSQNELLLETNKSKNEGNPKKLVTTDEENQ